MNAEIKSVCTGVEIQVERPYKRSTMKLSLYHAIVALQMWQGLLITKKGVIQSKSHKSRDTSTAARSACAKTGK